MNSSFNPVAVESALGVYAQPTRCCAHCGLSLLPKQQGPFCCTGCESVYELIRTQGLGRYYDLRNGVGQPVAEVPHVRDHKWVEATAARVNNAQGTERIELDIQGMHCAACVWLIEQLFQKQPGSLHVLVNPALGRAQLMVQPSFDLLNFVEDVEHFGYLLGPAIKTSRNETNDLLVRMGVCIAIAMNSMIFAISIYAGLHEGPIFKLFHTLNFALAAVSVVVGGSVFFRSAWHSLRRKIMHLDIPIAFGIIAAFSSSAYSYATRNASSAYFDTLSIFIALMLVGRWLQSRVLETNRRRLLESDGVEGLLTRRIQSDGVTMVPCLEIREGDRLLIAASDLIPVDATLEKDCALCSLDWINGESIPREFSSKDTIPAGAFNASDRAIVVRASQDFSASTLVDLLRIPFKRGDDMARSTAWWQKFTAVYVVGVLMIATLAFATWFLKTRDVGRALDVLAAVLIVTCPCALGIATPLAYEFAQAGLRRAGLFVRSPSLLDRATHIERIVFDKTGTLTTGTLSVHFDERWAHIFQLERNLLFNLVTRSTHPKSTALLQAIKQSPYSKDLHFDANLNVCEVFGYGLEVEYEGSLYRIGAPRWALAKDTTTYDLVFAKDAHLLCAFVTQEQPRVDAVDEIEQLKHDGFEVQMLTGDSAKHAHHLAQICGVEPQHVIAEVTANQKANWLRSHHDRRTLMIGDGINDSLVIDEAYCSGTPAIDRPFMAAKSDFYWITTGLRPIRLMLRISRALAQVVRRNIIISLGYNILTLGLAFAGKMSPFVCAIVMPVSSLTVILAVIASFSKRSSMWRL